MYTIKLSNNNVGLEVAYLTLLDRICDYRNASGILIEFLQISIQYDENGHYFILITTESYYFYKWLVVDATNWISSVERIS